MNYWLLLEKSDDTRISKGIDGYRDTTGEAYQYDSLVPNHRNLKQGDFAVFRKENEIIGVGTIGAITERNDTKIHRRCPNPKCNSTDIRERKTRTPQWKCGTCATEFVTPIETRADIVSFVAAIKDFSQLNAPPSVRDVKRCAADGDGTKSQLSILRLDPGRVQTLFEGIDISISYQHAPAGTGGQGFGLSQAERREVELHAMRLARALYEDKGWEVVDKSSSEPFDFLATRGEERRFIEVKGTTGAGLAIIVTEGEIRHIRANPGESALVVVSAIVLERNNGACQARGGAISTHEDPWVLVEDKLSPTQYRYETKK